MSVALAIPETQPDGEDKELLAKLHDFLSNSRFLEIADKVARANSQEPGLLQAICQLQIKGYAKNWLNSDQAYLHVDRPGTRIILSTRESIIQQAILSGSSNVYMLMDRLSFVKMPNQGFVTEYLMKPDLKNRYALAEMIQDPRQFMIDFLGAAGYKYSE